MNSSIADWLVKHRLILFILSFVLLAFVSYGATFLTVKSDYKIFFEADNPQLVANEMIQDRFSPAENVMLALNPANGDIFTRENLQAIEELTEASWQVPYSQRVYSVTNYQHSTVDGDELLVDNLVQDAGNLSDEEIERLRQIAINEPLIVNRLISPTAHVANITINLSMPEDQTLAMPEVINKVREIRADFAERYPDLQVLITGMTPTNYAFNEMNEKDSATLIPLMMLVIIVLVGVMLRSIAGVAITITVIALSVVVAISSMGWLNIPINNINFASPLIILTLAVADCIHLMSTYLKGMRQGLPQLEALRKSMDANLKAIFLTSITTAVGFLSMQFSESPPFRELGLVSAIGVVFAFLFSVTVMPQMMMWFSRKAPAVDTERSVRFSHLADFTLRHPGKLMLGTILVSAFFIAHITQNELNDDNYGYFKRNLEVRYAADFIENNLNGVNAIQYAMDSGEAQGIFDPAYLQKVDAFVQWYRQQPNVTHVYSYTDVFKRLNQNMHGDDPAYYKLPETREEAAQYSLLYEMSLSFGMDPNNVVDMNKSALRVTAFIKHAKAKEILEMEERAQHWFAEHAPELAAVGASPSIMFSHIGQQTINSMIKGTVLATVIISAILFVSLGSWKLGLMSIIPNAFPAAITLGIWGLFVSEVNMAVAVVFSVTLGIVVDDTVHFMSKFLRGFKEHGDINKAIHYAFEHVGAALVTTTVVLSTGFGMMALSDFNVNAILGTMVAMTIVIALIFDFLFLPSMIILLSRFLVTENNQTAVANAATRSETKKPSTRPKEDLESEAV